MDIRFIEEPTVRLISRPSLDWGELDGFLSDENLPAAPESIRAGDDISAAIAETAARICYMSYGRGRRDIEAFINNLLRSKDGSVFEHINYGFVFTGISRSLSHELVRHRAGFAYSQRSQRYVDESEGCAFVVPPALLEVGGVPLKAFKREMIAAMNAYQSSYELLAGAMPAGEGVSATNRRKVIRQTARSVLPNATETKIVVTANVRALRHFIEMRASEYADAEIRRLALVVLQILQVEAPLMFGDFVVKTLLDGTTVAEPRYSKV